MTRLKGNLPDRIYVLGLISLFLIIAGIAGLILSFVLGLNRPHIGLSVFLAGIVALYLIARFKSPGLLSSEIGTEHPKNHVMLRRVAPPIILLLIAPAVWLMTGHNDVLFFFFVACGSALLVPAFFESDSRGRFALCLCAVILVNLTLLWRLLQFSTGPIGVDTWFHVSVLRDTWELGGIPHSAETYQAFPLFHILGTQIVSVLGLHPFQAMMILSAVIAITPIFVFLIAKHFLPTSGALLAALVFSISDYFLLWQVWIIPMSLGILLFAMILYGGIVLNRGFPRSKAIIILVIIALILVHPLATVFSLLALALFELSAWAVNKADMTSERLRLTGILILFTVLTLGWWIYSVGPSGVDLIERAVTAFRTVFETFQLGEVQTVTRAAELPYSVLLARDMGLTALLFLFPVGLVAHGLNKDVRIAKIARLAIPSVVFIGLPFVAGVGGQHLFLLDRWFIFGYLFLCIASAAAILYGYGAANRTARTCAVCTLVGILVFAMISNPLGSVVQSPYEEEGGVRTYYTSSEILAPSFLVANDVNSTIIADGRYYRHLLELWYDIPNVYVPLTPDSSVMIDAESSGVLIVRTTLREEPVIVEAGPAFGYHDFLPETFWHTLDNSKSLFHTYDNGGVWIYDIE